MKLVKKNYRCPVGEIDLIMQDGVYLVFVEVKFRSTAAQGSPLCAVNRTKQKRISCAAAWYLIKEKHTENLPCRFDVVGIQGKQILWIKNAFDACW